MTHEYGEMINSRVIETAVATVFRLRKEEPGIPLKIHVDKAIHLAFSAAVIDDEDTVEKGLSGTHSAMISEVTQRVEQRLVNAARPKGG